MKFIDLGLIPYQQALTEQLNWLEKISDPQQCQEDVVLFCTHPPVVTLGRAFKGKDQGPIDWSGEVVETTRGGKATYHGPSQLVVYPIINLTRENRQHLPTRDLNQYLRLLERAIIEALKKIGIAAYCQSTPKGSPLQLTGVWVDEKKVVSVGVAVKKWTTYHGAAINLEKDSKAFQGISPCGFSVDTMISVEEILQKPISRKEFQEELAQQILFYLN